MFSIFALFVLAVTQSSSWDVGILEPEAKESLESGDCQTSYQYFLNARVTGVQSQDQKQYEVLSIYECEEMCCKEAEFECLSFIYIQEDGICYVMNISRVDKGVSLEKQLGWDYFEVFSRIKNICKKPTLDILFLLDGSGSVGYNFKTVKKWVKKVSANLDIDDERVSIGVVQYSHYYSRFGINDQPYMKTEIEIGKYSTYKIFANAVDRIELQGYTTYTGMALRKVAFDFNSTRNYGKDFNSQILILVTDGRANDPANIPKNAGNLRDMGVETYVVGIDTVNRDELRSIATGNKSNDDRVFMVNNFDSMNEVKIEINSLVCKWMHMDLQSLMGNTSEKIATLSTATDVDIS